MYSRVGEKRRIDDINLEDEEAIGSLCRLSGRPVSPKTAMEHEKRIRREIANSNERRRMQSINAGFASLKTLLPHHDGEKLSKAAILQQTAEYIYQLEQEKTRLLSQNSQLKRLLNQQHHSDTEGSPTGGDSPGEDRSLSSASPPPPSVTATTLGSPLPPPSTTALPLAGVISNGDPEENRAKDILDVRMQVDRDRRQRIKIVDDHLHVMESEVIYSEKTKDSSHQQVKMSYGLVDKFPSGVKIEIKNASENQQDSKSLQLSTASVHPALTTPVVLDKADLADKGDYEELQEIRLHKAMLKASDSVAAPVPSLPSRVSIPLAPPANISVTNGTAFRTAARPQTSPLISPTTILTVVPSNKCNSSVLELRGLSEVDESEISIPTATVEYMDEGSVGALRNHTVYIVNSNNNCQKSLDTICEAISYVEGNHMFPLEEQSGSNIKEEVVTDETFTVDEEQMHALPQELHHHRHHHHHSTIVTGSYDHGDVITTQPTNVHTTLEASMGRRMTLHMISPEPQEVPLELTTTHRATSGDSAKYFNSREIMCSSPQEVVASHHSPLLHSTRPGVIVVKHQ